MKKQYTLGELYLLKQELVNGTRKAKRLAYRLLKNAGIEIDKTVEPSIVMKTVYKIKEAAPPMKINSTKKVKENKKEE